MAELFSRCRVSEASKVLLTATNVRQRAQSVSEPARVLARSRVWVAILCGIFLLPAGCRSSHDAQRPSISFVHVPPNQAGGPELLDHLSGKVANRPPAAKIVAYAHNDIWWIQPFRSRPFTVIGADGNWSTATHLGTDYAVLLVSPEYKPAAHIAALPPVGSGVLAVAVAKGTSEQFATPKTIQFSGYEWTVSSSADIRDGEISAYEPSNAWVDEQGHLHLLMAEEGGQWHCAGIRLTRSLGYGTYRFVVQGSAGLPPSAVLAMFTRDDRQDQEDAAEMDIELGRWGKPQNRNADYVVQPYYIPENTIHFNVPAGPVTHVLRWEPGSATFRSFAGTSTASGGKKIMEHVFKSGVPIPAAETVHLDFYDFRHSRSGLHHPVEIVVDRFEYLP